MARPVPEINAGSMADIAFLLLIFFLVTTTMGSDYGIARLLPPIDQKQDGPEINARNVLIVNLNFRNDIQVGGKLIQIHQLKNIVKEFIENPTNNPSLSEKKETFIPYFGKTAVSKGIISLTNDMGTRYKIYLQIQDELTSAIDELREKISSQQFGKTFNKLNKEQQKAVTTIYPMSISEAEPKFTGEHK